MYLKRPLRQILDFFRRNTNTYANNAFLHHTVLANHCSFGEYCQVVHRAELRHSEIGKRTSIGRYTKVEYASIGSYCSISWETTIGAPAHPFQRASGHAFTYNKKFGLVPQNYFAGDRPITHIGNDVWIGCNVAILDGLTIGDGATIGAGAVVTKDVAPYEIVAGVPAKPIRKRFSEDIIQGLLEAQWWNLPDETIRANIDLFRKPVDADVVQQLKALKA